MDQFILTPYFLNEPLVGLQAVSGSDWQFNAAEVPPGDQQQGMSALHEVLAERVAESVRAGHRPVSIAGDCCSVIGVAAGLQRAGIEHNLIWLDAHGDFNTWETTPSGFLGGMPLAMLVGRGEQTMLHNVGLSPLPENRVMLSDARDLDPGEAKSLAGSGVLHLTRIVDLLDVSLREDPLLVHFDTDVLDPVEAPAMNYLAPGGPSAAEMQLVFAHLAGSGNVRAVSMSTWNPHLPGADATQRICMQLLRTLLGG